MASNFKITTQCAEQLQGYTRILRIQPYTHKGSLIINND